MICYDHFCGIGVIHMLKFRQFVSETKMGVHRGTRHGLSSLTEAKDDASREMGASNHTMGVLHELLVGKNLQGSHMETHDRIDDNGRRETPKAAHDRLKAQIHPNDYRDINNKARSAAADLKAHVEEKHPGFKVHRVTHTSKPGDTEKVTGIKAKQSGEDSDSSDNYITIKHPKTGEVRHIGVSLKVSKNTTKSLPSSNLGIESSGSKSKELLKQHQENIHAEHPEIKNIKKEAHHKDLSEARKEWARNNPEKHAAIKLKNKSLLAKVALHQAAGLQAHLDSGNHEHVINHIRNVLAARKTPAQKAGVATFIKHTTYSPSSGVKHHISDPSEDHEHILKDHANITVRASGGSVNFIHTDPKTGKVTKFARQAHKFTSQSDPLSNIVSSGRAN